MLQYSHHPSPFTVGAFIVAGLTIEAPIRPLPCLRPLLFPRGEGAHDEASFIVAPLLAVLKAEWQGPPGGDTGQAAGAGSMEEIQPDPTVAGASR